MPATTPEWGANPASKPQKERVLVTVKAYPNPSRKYIETVCVAGITEGGRWIRLYPVPYRFLEHDQRFKTYNWIEASVTKSRDIRPESHYIDISTIKILRRVDTKGKWQERRRLLAHLASPSLEHLQDRNQTEGVSLGMIRPKAIRRLVIAQDSAQWSPVQLAKLRQQSLMEGFNEDGTYDTIKELEKVPYKFKYDFLCDDARCSGHSLSIISWEVIQSYRHWRQQYGTEWVARFRQKYEQELPSANYDLHFFVGTVSNHPKMWTIIGLFYPPKADVLQRALL